VFLIKDELHNITWEALSKYECLASALRDSDSVGAETGDILKELSYWTAPENNCSLLEN